MKKDKKLQQAIHTFFDIYTMPDALSSTDTLCNLALEKKYYIKESPGNLLYFHDNLCRLLKAASRAARQVNIKLTAKEAASPLEPKLFIGRHRYHTAWEYFPRQLTLKEFINPVKAVDHFFRCYTYKQWKEILYMLLQCALSPESLNETGVELNISSIRDLLKKMIEALHIIEIRITGTNTKVQNI